MESKRGRNKWYCGNIELSIRRRPHTQFPHLPMESLSWDLARGPDIMILRVPIGDIADRVCAIPLRPRSN